MLLNVLNNIRVASLQTNLCFKIIATCWQQKLLTSTLNDPTSSLNSSEINQKKPKKTLLPKITLIAQDNISVTTLEDAQRLSKRRDLKLVKIVDLDTKTQRSVYKLMTGAEYHAEDLKQREQKKQEKQNSNAPKGEKILTITSNIAEHDLNVHVNKILKLISKNYEVRVVINGNAANMEQAESVYSFLASHLQQESRLLQKRTKGHEIKFQVLPPKKNKENMENS